MRRVDRPRRPGSRLLRKNLPAAAGRLWHRFVNILEIINKEIRFSRNNRMPVARRLALLRAGFLSESGLLYEQSGHSDLKDYLTDWGRLERTARLDEPWVSILDDKLSFWGFMRNFSEHVAPVLGVVRGGRLVRLEATGSAPAAAGLAALRTKLVLKPCSGSGGMGICVYAYHDGSHALDGEPLTDVALLDRLAGEIWLVCPFLEQAGYARAVFPAVTNTIRLLTLYDEEAGEAFLARAVHKFGRRGTGAVDNWEKGGISARIDLASGRLGKGACFYPERRLRVYADHPDSGAPIEGAAIPDWSAVRDGLVELASRLPFLPYIGWDVVVTDGGYALIEGNNRPGVSALQVHGPLLDDPRVRRFYERHHVI